MKLIRWIVPASTPVRSPSRLRWIGCGLMLCAGLVVSSFPALATVYGPLTIKQIQDPNTAPNPVGVPNPAGSAAGDTVGQVCGILTGFDHFPTGFAVYIQSSQGGGWTGIDVFTGGRNLLGEGYALGDSLCVESSALAEFSTVTAPCALAGVDGETEIISKQGSFGPSSALPITRVSAGHPLPPFRLDTVAGLQERCDNSNAEQWEGCMVRVNGPMRICRTNATGNLGTFRAVLVVNNTVCPPGSGGPCDSLFIDLSTLADPALSPGNVGQIVDFAQGIYNERSRGYRIQARDGADYGLQAPPALARVFAIATNKYRVIVDRAVTQASAENEANYTLSSTLGAPNLATQVNGTTIDLTVSGTGLSGGDIEAVTVNGLTAVGSGLTMTSGQGAAFHFDVLSPAQVQGGDPDSLAANPCRDVGRYQTGGPTTIRGIVQAKFDNTYYLSATNNPRDGMAVFAPPQILTVGRRYVIVGTVQERFDETQMSTIVYVADEGAFANPAAVAQTIPLIKNTVCDLSASITNGEDYEDMLVTINVKVAEDDLSGRNFQVTTVPPTSDSIFVANLTGSAYTYAPNQNDLLDVTGILHYAFGAFQICPRSDADIQEKPPGFTFPPAGCDSFPTTMHLTFNVPGYGPTTIQAVGPVKVARSAPHVCPTDGLMRVDTEIIDGRMVGQVPGLGKLEVLIGACHGLEPSFGYIREKPSNPRKAESYFSVHPKLVFESSSSPLGVCVDGLAMLAEIGSVPPACGTAYEPPPSPPVYTFKDCCTGEVVTLLGTLVHSDHTTCSSGPPTIPTEHQVCFQVTVSGTATAGTTRLKIVKAGHCDSTVTTTGPVSLSGGESSAVTASRLGSALANALAGADCDCKVSVVGSTVTVCCDVHFGSLSVCLEGTDVAAPGTILGAATNRGQSYSATSFNGGTKECPCELSPGLPVCGVAAVDDRPPAKDGTPGEPMLVLSPNPFDPQVTIRFTTSREGNVRLEIYDNQGRLVEKILDEWVAAGPHSAKWGRTGADGAGLSPGMYLVRLTSPDGVKTRKAINLR